MRVSENFHLCVCHCVCCVTLLVCVCVCVDVCHSPETVTSFKYLGSVKTYEGSKPKILSRIAQATAALTRLKPVWNDRSISLSSKTRLMRPLITSIFLYACESWNRTAELQRRIHAMEMKCYCKILHISYKDLITNEVVQAKIQQAIRLHEDNVMHCRPVVHIGLFALVKSWYSSSARKSFKGHFHSILRTL